MRSNSQFPSSAPTHESRVREEGRVLKMNIQHQPIAKSQQKIGTYTELRQQIHDDLRIQHPEWIEANGESPMCDAYEARLIEELDSFRRT